MIAQYERLKQIDSGDQYLDAPENEENSQTDMAWASPSYSKSQVDKAGHSLFSSDLFAYGSSLPIVDNFRAAHNYPLNTFQDGLRKRAKLINSDYIVAQRIKRLSSITAKLQRFPTMRLSMMQDIGGCRAVLAGVKQVQKLVQNYKDSDIKHILHHEDDYISNPQLSGYRGIHLVYRYQGRKTVYNGLKIEIQIRSYIQHAWATAVETVGMFIQQALKSSQGEQDWLRFFSLMGTIFAQMEKTNPVPNTPTDSNVLKQELHSYCQKLDVENHLHTYGAALQELEKNLQSAHYFLLTLDPSTKKLEVTGYAKSELEKASDEYLNIEKSIKGSTKDAVLVSVDSITALRRAYPNYFLDTNVFLELVKTAIK